MKNSVKLFFLLILIINANSLFSQSTTLERYFQSRGVKSLSKVAHPTNDYLSGTYDINNRYIDVSIRSEESVFGGPVETVIRVIRGTGNLYFSDLIVVREKGDFVPAFNATKTIMDIYIKVLKELVGEQIYNQIQQSLAQVFDTDINHWTGKMWALFALNLDYYEFLN